MPEELQSQADKAILERVIKLAPTATAESLARLAEALAWVQAPSQPHGSRS